MPEMPVMLMKLEGLGMPLLMIVSVLMFMLEGSGTPPLMLMLMLMLMLTPEGSRILVLPGPGTPLLIIDGSTVGVRVTSPDTTSEGGVDVMEDSSASLDEVVMSFMSEADVAEVSAKAVVDGVTSVVMSTLVASAVVSGSISDDNMPLLSFGPGAMPVLLTDVSEMEDSSDAVVDGMDDKTVTEMGAFPGGSASSQCHFQVNEVRLEPT